MKKIIVPLVCAALSLAIFASACNSESWWAAREPEAAPATGSTAALAPSVSLTVYIATDHGATEPVQTVGTAAPTQEPEPVNPFTDEETVILAKVMYAEAYIVPSKARQAAVGWCALNRLDDGHFGETLAEVLTTPGQFDYRADAPVYPEMLELAENVLSSWAAEKQGDPKAGRTLPADYLYFDGDGRENHFRKTAGAAQEWDWSLRDPYTE